MEINLAATPEQPRVRTFANDSSFYLLTHVLDDFPSESDYVYGFEIVHYLQLIRPSLEQYFNRRLPLAIRFRLKYFPPPGDEAADYMINSEDEATRLAAEVFNVPRLEEIRERYPYPHGNAYYNEFRRIVDNRSIGLTLKLSQIEATPGSNTAFGTFVRRTASQIKKQLQLMSAVGSNTTTGMIAEIQVKIAPHESLANLQQQIIPPIPLTGGFYKELAPVIRQKEAIINIKNADQLCFQYCVICHKLDFYSVRNPDRVTHYQTFDDGTPLRQGVRKPKVPKDVGVDFSMLTFPVQLEDIDDFEAVNKLGVHVYGYTQTDNSWVIVVYRSPKKQYKDELKLMLDDGPYSLIKNWSRLQAMRSGSMGEMRNTRCKKCPTCLTEYYSKELFEKHIKERRCVKAMQGRPIRQRVLPPAQDKNGFKPVVRYKPSSELALHPCVVYADIEVFSNQMDPDKVDSNIDSNIKQNTVTSYPYTAVGGDFTPSDERIYRLRRYGSS